jgi:ribosomal protein S18 acetylase RimI-like enzyme
LQKHTDFNYYFRINSNIESRSTSLFNRRLAMSTGKTDDKGNIVIRHLMRSDIDTILEMDKKIGKGRSSITYRDLISMDPGGLLDFSFIAEYNGKAVGFLLARIQYVYIPFTEVCLIHGVGVDPEYQKHHIGSRLVNGLLSHCQAEDIHTVRALVDQNNDTLRRFIESLGFQRSEILNYDKNFEN